MKKEEKTKLSKERILKVAMTEFSVNGYVSGSMNHICETGIPKGLLYHNFSGKDELYLCCVRKTFHELLEYLKNEKMNDHIETYMKARLVFFHEHIEEAHIFYETVLQPPKAIRLEIETIKKEFDLYNESIYLNVIKMLALRTGVTTEDALDYFRRMQEMFHGYFFNPVFSNQAFPDFIENYENELNKLLDYMIYGIAERR